MKGLIKAVLLVAVLVGMASCEKEKSVRKRKSPDRFGKNVAQGI